MTAAPTRRIGSSTVSAIGLGCASLSLSPDLAADPARAEAVVRAALDSGVTLLDTATAYTTADERNHNEKLIGRVLSRMPFADRPFISSKGGHRRRGPDFPIDARPGALKEDCEASLLALQVEVIDLYSLHWADATVPIEDSVGALRDLQLAGKIREVGLSNVTIDQLGRARQVTHIASVQSRFSIFDTSNRDVVAACERDGVAFLAHSPLGGSARAASVSAADPIVTVAAELGLSTAQAGLAWLLTVSPALIVVVGATRPETARGAAAAMSLRLTADDLRRLDDAGKIRSAG